MSRVLLTGATGFIGRNALAALAQAGHEVHAVARRPGPDADGVSWHEADLLESVEVVEEIEPEILVHLAWYAEHGKFWSSVENLRWVEASLALLRAFARAGGRRAVVAGTCAEYGWSRELYAEDAPLQPATLYGAAKHGLHVVSRAFAEQAGISLAWGRVFFLYGPFESPGRFVPSIIRPLLLGEPAPMTDGTQRRDLMHAADVGAAFAALADSQVTGAVNVASGRAVVLRDVAREIARELDAEELLQVGARPMPAGDPPVLLADVSRLREDVGWTPAIDLADGLSEVIGWWRERLHAEGEAAGSGEERCTP
jgi:nucleoside-diphosphate-sugar epimerase